MKHKLLAAVAMVASLTTAGANAANLYIDYIESGQRLLPGDILRSGNGKYELSLQIDGLLARWYTAETSYWNSGARGTSALFQYDGNFALYRGAELGQNAVWTVNKGVFPHAIYRLGVGNDGSLSAYPPLNFAIWSLPPPPVTPPGGGTPGPGQCPGGGGVGLYPACVDAGTMFQWTIPIPACSPGEAARFAYAQGYTPGACR